MYFNHIEAYHRCPSENSDVQIHRLSENGKTQQHPLND